MTRTFPASLAEKAETCATLEDLRWFEQAFPDTGRAIPDDVKAAIARRRAALELAEARRK